MVPNPVTAFNLESFNELLTLTPYIAEQVLAYNTKHKIYTVDEYDQYHADKQAHMPRSYRIEGYIDQNINISRSFDFAHFSMKLRAEVLNLCDVNYDVIKNYPMPGRQYRFSVKFTY